MAGYGIAGDFLIRKGQEMSKAGEEKAPDYRLMLMRQKQAEADRKAQSDRADFEAYNNAVNSGGTPEEQYTSYLKAGGRALKPEVFGVVDPTTRFSQEQQSKRQGLGFTEAEKERDFKNKYQEQGQRNAMALQEERNQGLNSRAQLKYGIDKEKQNLILEGTKTAIRELDDEIQNLTNQLDPEDEFSNAPIRETIKQKEREQASLIRKNPAVKSQTWNDSQKNKVEDKLANIENGGYDPRMSKANIDNYEANLKRKAKEFMDSGKTPKEFQSYLVSERKFLKSKLLRAKYYNQYLDKYNKTKGL